MLNHMACTFLRATHPMYSSNEFTSTIDSLQKKFSLISFLNSWSSMNSILFENLVEYYFVMLCIPGRVVKYCYQRRHYRSLLADLAGLSGVGTPRSGCCPSVEISCPEIGTKSTDLRNSVLFQMVGDLRSADNLRVSAEICGYLRVCGLPHSARTLPGPYSLTYSGAFSPFTVILPLSFSP